MTDKPSVLIVDDNPSDVDIASYYLRNSTRFGPTLSAADGAEALSILEHQRASKVPWTGLPLGILLDINMPRMNGFEFLEETEKRYGIQPDFLFIAILTTSELCEDIQRAGSHPLVQSYFSKPFTKENAIEFAEKIDTRTLRNGQIASDSGQKAKSFDQQLEGRTESAICPVLSIHAESRS